MIFDTHCHIYDDKYEESIDEIISRCFSNGLDYMCVIGDNLEHSKKCIEIASIYNKVICAIGVHPQEVDTDSYFDLDKLYELSKNNKVKAIGEIGLDYYWDNKESTKAKQKEYFIKQIEIANDLDLPIIIHARDAVEDTIKLIKEHPCKNKGVFHCYSGSVEQLKEIMKLGYFIGLDGPVTYKNAITPKEVAKVVPLDRLVIETDSPYLTPTPYRGQINYPYYVKEVLKEIARLREMDAKELEDIIFNNSMRLFKL